MVPAPGKCLNFVRVGGFHIQDSDNKYRGGKTMPSWKCSNCGYTFDADSHPNECPSCKEKCEFVDNTCYTPDCAAEGTDDRIGKP